MSDLTVALYRWKRDLQLDETEEKLISAWKKGMARSKRIRKGPAKKTISLIERAVELHVLGDEAHPTGFSDFKALAEAMGIPYQRIKDLRYEYPKLWEEAYAALVPDAVAETGHLVSVARLKAMQEIAKRSAKAPEVIESVMLDKTEPGSTRTSAAKDLLGMVGITEAGPSEAMQLSRAAIDGMKSAIDTLKICVTNQPGVREPLTLEAELVEEEHG